MKLSLKEKILHILAEISFADKIAQQRAIDIVGRSKVGEYLKPGGIYLDIGTGFGHIVEQVIQENHYKGIIFLALDPIWRPLRKVQNRLIKKANVHILFIKGVGQQLPIKNKSLDGVLLFFVLHHVTPEEGIEILNEIKRVLKDDGLLFLVEDTPENEQERKRNAKWDRRINFESKDKKHNYRNNEEWLEFIKNSGYKLIDQTYFEYSLPKLDKSLIHHWSYILQLKH